MDDDALQAVARILVVDGNNVMGTRPDGWWRDRQGAVRRLLGRLQRFRRTTDARIVVFFDVPHPDLPEGDHDGVTVLYAARRGRDAADERILEFLDTGAAVDAGSPQDRTRTERPVEVVTSDPGRLPKGSANAAPRSPAPAPSSRAWRRPAADCAGVPCPGSSPSVSPGKASLQRSQGGRSGAVLGDGPSARASGADPIRTRHVHEYRQDWPPARPGRQARRSSEVPRCG